MRDIPAIPYRLGLPAWAFPGWKDRYWSTDRSPLDGYSQVFNTVEGNTAFYRVPDAKSVASWQRVLEGRDFTFSFKLPKTVTHDRRPSIIDLEAFLGAIAPLGEHLGPLMVQLPASVDPQRLAQLAPVFDRIAESHRFAVELRHPLFFAEPERAEPLLDTYRCGRVMLDTRALYGGDASHPDVAAARHEKPDVPVLDTVYNGLSFVRMVLHPDAVYNGAVLGEWAERTAASLAAGHETIVMIHCPNNLHCPAFAEQFHRGLQSHLPEMPNLPPWPLPQQAGLF